MSDGAKELILFLFKIDIEEALFISIPEEVTEFVDEGPDFQGNLKSTILNIMQRVAIIRNRISQRSAYPATIQSTG